MERLHKGLQSLVSKNKVEYIRGTATAGRRDTHPVATIDCRRRSRPASALLDSKDTILATGSRVKSLPGLVPDGVRIVTSDDILKSDDVPQRSIGSSAAVPWASSSPATTATWAPR